MKLSEAIRLGAMMRKQGFHYSLHNDATCAIGAALDAVGALKNRTTVGSYPQGITITMLGWPVLRKRTLCGFCTIYPRKKSLNQIIQHWNDYHQFTRERIADLVASHEPVDRPEDALAIGEACRGQEVPEQLPEPIPDPEEAPLEVAKC